VNTGVTQPGIWPASRSAWRWSCRRWRSDCAINAPASRRRTGALCCAAPQWWRRPWSHWWAW